MPRAVWHGAVIAESDDTVIVEGNHYFPRESLDERYVREGSGRSLCPWKGVARYLDVQVGDQVNRGAAWTYPRPWPLARKIRGRVAFWRGVRVEP